MFIDFWLIAHLCVANLALTLETYIWQLACVALFLRSTPRPTIGFYAH